jgi:hypothetical protein
VESGSAVSVLVENGAPVLALHRGNAAFVMRTDGDYIGQRVVAEVHVTATTTQFQVNGALVGSGPIVAPFRLFRPGAMVFGYSAALTPSDENLKSYPQEQIIQPTTAEYVLHGFSFDKGIDADPIGPYNTIMTSSGNPLDDANWSDGVPTVVRAGLIPDEVTATLNEVSTVTFPAHLTVEGVLEQWGAGALLFDANSRGDHRRKRRGAHARQPFSGSTADH